MGIKGELEGGFPQPKPAFVITIDWDSAHMLGPTTQPKNHLSYMKIRGTVRSAHDSGLPPFAAEFVDGGAWVQQEDLPSGETWVKTEISVLLRVVEPSNTLAGPGVAETETGFVRLKWNGVGPFPKNLNVALEKDDAALIRQDDVGSVGAAVFTFQTGDQRYKYLEHAAYIGRSRFVVTPEEGGRQVFHEFRVSHLAA